MKCKHCDGVGFFENGASQFKCVYCDGTGEVEQTNEEWFCGLSTEEKAEWIFNDRVEQSDGWYEQQGHTKAEVMEWLKEKHE